MKDSKLISIFDYWDVGEYLQALFQEIKKKRPRYSIRAWSQKLDIPQSTLTRVLLSTREIPKTKIDHFVEILELDLFEACYFELISSGTKPSSEDRLRFLNQMLREQQKQYLASALRNEQS